ncbi:MAG: NADH-quinone oxidoreductase subunit J [Leptospiraceae bacterium]|nr:NADH-quinone oxidoreductase subunit J [Leptospiraceae bacterium]MDW7975835.1 NADH-quinone oxidoreductase subunit J [Leptospiraceae bacterium]
MFEILFFSFLSVVLIVSSFLVITRVNPISSALYLVIVFLALAGLYGMLSAGFIAAIQILVYAGGILVLIIFVIMIMNLTMQDLLPLKTDYLLLISLSLVILGGSLIPIVLAFSNFFHLRTKEISDGFGSIKEVASILFTKFIFPFEMLSILLLTAIIGALVIAKRKL